MKITYDLIEKNLKIYNEAREIFPIILDYENLTISRGTMFKLGLGDFADFRDFQLRLMEREFNPIGKVSYRQLKPLIIENTTTDRFKTYIKNRTQKQFIEICNDYKKFDRLLQGRVISRSRRRTNRSHERIEGITYSIVPLLNYIISNDIEVSDVFRAGIINHDTKWYIDAELKYDHIPIKEIELTKGIINNFVDVIEESKIDFRKLNLEYITDTLITRLKSLMDIPKDTNIKSLVTANKLTKDKFYSVNNSYIQQGHLKVMVRNDDDRLEWYNYSLFEDMAIRRDELLNKLLS